MTWLVWCGVVWNKEKVNSGIVSFPCCPCFPWRGVNEQGRIPIETAEQRANEEEVVGKTTTQMYRAPEMVDLYMERELTEKVDVWVSSRRMLRTCTKHGKLSLIIPFDTCSRFPCRDAQLVVEVPLFEVDLVESLHLEA